VGFIIPELKKSNKIIQIIPEYMGWRNLSKLTNFKSVVAKWRDRQRYSCELNGLLFAVLHLAL
jgi:hypothetical protein